MRIRKALLFNLASYIKVRLPAIAVRRNDATENSVRKIMCIKLLQNKLPIQRACAQLSGQLNVFVVRNR